LKCEHFSESVESVEFGKVDRSQLSQIDLRLPQDDSRTWSTLKSSRELRLRPDLHRVLPVTPARIGVGAPAWAVKDWLGKVYPVGTPAKDFLSHYAKQFNSIELNSTHYGIPSEDTVSRWRDSTPSGFKFNVKFFQNISHHSALDENAPLVRQFVNAILPLEDRLGLCFLQMPPTFAISSLPRLARFLGQIPRDIQLAVEVRHPSFFRDHRLVDSYFNLLADYSAHVVITDVAGRRDVLHTSLPTSRVMIRFIGNAVDDIDDARLATWSERLGVWLKLGLDQVEFFIHEPEDRLMPEVAGRFIDKMNLELALQIPRWKPADPDAQNAQLKLI
jgi:uncharacterized protein YecE (DUF72 family)